MYRFVPLLFISLNIFGQSVNRLYSRLYHLNPPFHESKTSISKFEEQREEFLILTPIDNRVKFHGEPVVKRIKVQNYKDFWSSTLNDILSNKLKNELITLGYSKSTNSSISLQPIIEVMYTCPVGFLWLKCYSKVRIRIIFYKQGAEIFNKSFETIYITDGTDGEYEGSMTDTIENFANITLGMCLRKTLDKFYVELKDSF